MKKRFNSKSHLALTLTLFACSQPYSVQKDSTQALTEIPGGGGGTPESVTERFFVSPQVSHSLDILFVIDNSGSMSDEQSNLASSFDLFIQDMQKNSLDFQIGIISTDASRNSSVPLGTAPWTSNAYKNFSNLGTGSLLSYLSNEKVLSRNSPNLNLQFNQNVKLGTSGSGNEMAIQSLIYALSPELSGAGMWNNSLIRDEALLSIIIVSDEDETRDMKDSNKYLFQYSDEKEARFLEFERKALSLKKDKRALVRVDAIVSDPKSPCSTAHKTGTSYPDLAKRFGGQIFNICNPFSHILSSLGSNITTQVMNTFALQGNVTSLSKVSLNGIDLKINVDYTYNSLNKSLSLIGKALDTIRSRDSTLEVIYIKN